MNAKSEKLSVVIRFLTVLWVVVALPQLLVSQALSQKEAREMQGVWNRAIANYQFAVQNNYVVQSSNFQAAIEDFTSILERVPKFAEAYFYRAAVLFVTQKWRDAFIDIRESARLNPNIAKQHPRFFSFSQVDSLAFEAMLAFAVKNYAKADSLLRLPQLRQHGVLNDEFMISLSTISKYNLGKIQEACTECQFAKDIGNNDAEELSKRICGDLPISFDDSFPKNLQFFPRNKQTDSALIELKGRISGLEADSIIILKYRNGALQSRIATQIIYQTVVAERVSQKGGLLVSYLNQAPSKRKNATQPIRRAEFALAMSIKAECAEYGFKLLLRLKNGSDTTIAERDSLIAGDVYLFAGQSNMVLGNVPISTKAEYLRTYNTSTAALWQTMAATNIFSQEAIRIGAFGGALSGKITEEKGIPICVIHAAESATSIQQHFPSKKEQQRTIYNTALMAAKKSGLRQSIRGIVWYQGESNTGLGYTSEFMNLWRFWQKDYPSVERVFVVQIRPQICNGFEQNDIREEQRRLPEVLPICRVIAANGVEGYDGCHFSQEGYQRLAEIAYYSVAKELYGSTDSVDVISPTVKRVSFADSNKTSLIVEFAPSTSHITVSQPDSAIINGQAYYLKDAFGIEERDGETNKNFLSSREVITGVQTDGTNHIRVFLKPGIIAERLSYIPDKFYAGTTTYFVGPWLQTKRNVGVLSFYRVKIEERKP